jgi:methylase of polypeptide subunit release factors
MTFPPAAPRIGSDLDRRALVDCLARAEFTEASVFACLGIADYETLDGDGRAQLAARFRDRDLRGLVIRLFVLGAPVAADDVDAVLAAHEILAFQRTGLVAPFDGGPGSARLYSPVWLVPLSDGSSPGRTLLIVSDRADKPDWSRFDHFPDIVFPGHGPLTRQFLQLLPVKRTHSALDLCSGTGIAALVTEPLAERVAAVDVTERCTAFARFNSWLNGCQRITIHQGDLYDPVRGDWFDRIMSHPPYVPALTDRVIYRDGGASGDRLVSRIVAGLPDHLNRGGSFHMLTMAMDTAEGSFEERVRRWLGARQGEFDVVFAFGSAMTPAEFARSLTTKKADSEAGDYEKWIELFATLQVIRVVYGALFARRFDPGTGPAQTRRLLVGPRTGAEGFDWMGRCFDWRRRPDHRQLLLASRPVLANGATANIHNVAEGGQFVPKTFSVSTEEAPFKVRLETDAWVVRLLSTFDGHKTAGQVYAEARAANWIPTEFTETEFVDSVGLFVERCLLAPRDPALS